MSKQLALTYNSQLERISIPEYGRHVQGLAEHLLTIDDAEKRMAGAERIVRLMAQVTNQGKMTDDVKQKLWRHLHIITDNKLNLELEGIQRPNPEHKDHRPSRIPYPKNNARYRHYGQYIQRAIDKALKEEHEEKRHAFFSCIASYMKTSYMLWNRDLHIEDQVILDDLASIVDGRGPIPENLRIVAAKVELPKLDGKSKKRKKGKHQGRRKRR